MNNHLNILPKQASFNLKCFKMRGRLGLRPKPRWWSLGRSPRPPSRDGLRAFGARNSLFLNPNILLVPINPPPNPTFLEPLLLLDLNCMDPLTYFSLIRQLLSRQEHPAFSNCSFALSALAISQTHVFVGLCKKLKNFPIPSQSLQPRLVYSASIFTSIMSHYFKSLKICPGHILMDLYLYFKGYIYFICLGWKVGKSIKTTTICGR